jgi:hypothetical protein
MVSSLFYSLEMSRSLLYHGYLWRASFFLFSVICLCAPVLQPTQASDYVCIYVIMADALSSDVPTAHYINHLFPPHSLALDTTIDHFHLWPVGLGSFIVYSGKRALSITYQL